MEITLPSKKRRGAPRKEFNPAKMYCTYLDSLDYPKRSLFLAKLMQALEADTMVVARFRTLNSHHTLPHRLIINELAGVDIYKPTVQEE